MQVICWHKYVYNTGINITKCKEKLLIQQTNKRPDHTNHGPHVLTQAVINVELCLGTGSAPTSGTAPGTVLTSHRCWRTNSLC